MRAEDERHIRLVVCALPPLGGDVGEVSAVEVAEGGCVGCEPIVGGLDGRTEEGSQSDEVSDREIGTVGTVVWQEDVAFIDSGTDDSGFAGEVSGEGACGVVGKLGTVIDDRVECQTGSSAIVGAGLQERKDLCVRDFAETVNFSCGVEVAAAQGGGDEGKIRVLRVNRSECEERGSGVHD